MGRGRANDVAQWVRRTTTARACLVGATTSFTKSSQMRLVSRAPATRLWLDACAQTSLASHWPETILSTLRPPDPPPGLQASIRADPGPLHTESLAAHPKGAASTHQSVRH